MLAFLLYPFFTNQPSTAYATSTRIESNSGSSIDLERLIIGVEPNKSSAEVRSLAHRLGLRLIKYWPEIDAALVEIESAPLANMQIEASSQNAEQALALLETTRTRLEQLSELRYATYNERIRVVSRPADPSPPAIEPNPNDPEFFHQWASPMIEVVRSWNISQGNPEVIIAVLDSGINKEHPDLDTSRFWTNEAEAAGEPGVDDDNNGLVDDIGGWDWVDEDSDPSNDGYGHGTHVGGTIAATIGNNLGISGLGRNVTILPLRILDNGGGGYISDLVDALIYAKNANARVANLSLVLDVNSITVANAINLVSNDMMIVSATGNDGVNVYWPAAYANTVAVAATNIQDAFAPLSNRGPEVDLAAPGIDILSTGRLLNYIENSGTSMATPHVSALAGLISSLRPDFSNAEILDVMQSTAVDINADEYPGVDEFIGHGRINFYEALLSASNGLQLQSTDFADLHTFSHFPVEYDIRVKTPVDSGEVPIPVRGAVVHYKLLNSNDIDAANAMDIRGYTLTDDNGIATIAFWAPSDTGEYILRAQVGQEVSDFPLTVYTPPATVSLSVGSSSIRAGDGMATVSLDVRDENGELIPGPLPFRLVTTSGSFGNNQQSIKSVTNNGVSSATFYAGTEATVATIRVQFANRELDTKTIQIVPNVANTLEIFSDRSVIRTDLGETSAILTLVTKDMYGNLIRGELSFNMYATMGSIESTLLQVLGRDEVSTKFTVPSDASGTAKVWASLPSSQLLSEIIIDVASSPVQEGTASLPNSNDVTGSTDTNIVRTKALLPLMTKPLLCTTIQVEAESGALSGDFVIAEDPNASGGAFVHVPPSFPVGNINTESRAVYQFDVPNAGNYKIATSVLAQNKGTNSFFFTVNGLPEAGDVYNIATLGTTYVDDYVTSRYSSKPLELALNAGQNQVTFYLREAGARLDAVALEEICSAD